VTSTVAQVGFEQYVYVKNNETMMFVPIFTFEGSNHTYLEARYNYEEFNAFSLYLGRTFSKSEKVAYSVTPILGAVVGKFKGGSVGVNALIEHKNIFFSSQSQYTVSFQESNSDFLFAWSDLAYQPRKWLYVGLSAQQTFLPKKKTLHGEFGIALGFIAGKWTFPLYCFQSADDLAYLVIGISYSDTLRVFKKNK
jgi:hypothetical protein